MKLLKRRHFTATFLRASRTERTESLSLLLSSSPTILLYWFFDVDEGNFFWTQCKLHQSIITILKGTFGIIIAESSMYLSLSVSVSLCVLSLCVLYLVMSMSLLCLYLCRCLRPYHTHTHTYTNT